MSAYPHDAILFELLADNGAPIPVGEIVEFMGWPDDSCIGAIEARHAFGGAFGYPHITEWTYHWSSLKPLTPGAVNIMGSLRADDGVQS